MIITVPYGTGSISAALPDSIRVDIVSPECARLVGSDDERIEEALNNPIGTSRLEEMVLPQDRVLIIVNDHTRPGPNRKIVHGLLSRLAKAGVRDSNIRFICATGSHRAPTDEEMRRIVGDDVTERYEFVLHDCKNKENLFFLGNVNGLDIWLNKALLNADFIIATGLITPHHTAGFSGGRKSILPGVAGFDTLKVHHSLPMRPYHPAMGMIEGNAFHETALQAAKIAKVRFIVNAVQDMKKQNVCFVAGPHGRHAHLPRTQYSEYSMAGGRGCRKPRGISSRQ